MGVRLYYDVYVSGLEDRRPGSASGLSNLIYSGQEI